VSITYLTSCASYFRNAAGLPVNAALPLGKETDMSNDISSVGARVAQTVLPASVSPTQALPRTVAAMPAATAAEQAHTQTHKPAVLIAKREPVIKVDPEEMRRNLHEAMQRLNDQAAQNGRGLNFSVDEELNRHIITVRKTETGEVVRQIPTEVAIKVAHSIEDVKGLLLDEQS
jgi:flagellar protein FlaG